MAPGRKTGGRNFPNFNPGRPLGAKDKAPRTFRSLVAQVLEECPEDIKGALKRGATGRQAHRYLAIMAGLEKQQVEVGGPDGGPVAVRFVDAGD